jgi:hypothetical protein
MGNSTLPRSSQSTIIHQGMDKLNKLDIKPGSWGGTGVSLVIEKGSATAEFDCATVLIQGPIKAGRDGRFTIVGSLKRSGPGPIRTNFTPKPQDVQFTGRIKGRQMTLKVVMAETDELFGTYTLELGKTPHLRKCR